MDSEDDSNLIQQFFGGITFKFDGLDEEDQDYLSDGVSDAGGKLVSTDFQGEVDYLVTPCTGGSTGHRFKKHLSLIWLEDCLDQGELLDVEYYHQIIQVDKELKPLEGVVTRIAFYRGSERQFLKCVVECLGGFPHGVFDKWEPGTRVSTHMICPGVDEMLVNKILYNEALMYKVPVINEDWLRACLREKKWVSESPFLVGDSNMFTPSKPMPEEVQDKAEMHNTKSISNEDMEAKIKTINREKDEVIKKLEGVLKFLESIEVKNEECFVKTKEAVDDVLASLKFLPTEPSFDNLPMEIKTQILSYLPDSGAWVASSVCREWREIIKKSRFNELQLFDQLENKNSPLESIILSNLDLIKLNQSRLIHCIVNKTRRLTLKQSENGMMLDVAKLSRKLKTLSKDSKLLHLNLEYLEYDDNKYLSEYMADALCNVYSVKIGPEFNLNLDIIYRILINLHYRTVKIAFLDIDQDINWMIKISPKDLKKLIKKMKGLELRGTFTSEQVEAARSIPGVEATLFENPLLCLGLLVRARISKTWPVVVKN